VTNYFTLNFVHAPSRRCIFKLSHGNSPD
jgi:hypothetical protein